MMRAALLGAVLLVGGWWNAFQRVHEANRAQQQGLTAYAGGNYRLAAAALNRARALGVRNAPLLLNLGHAYARTGQAAAARVAYGQAAADAAPHLRSVARQQLAVLAAAEGSYPQAVALLHQALIDNPANAAARYNYELLQPLLGRRNRPRLPPPPAPGAANSPTKKSKSESAQQPGSGPSQPAPAAAGPGPGAAGGQPRPGTGSNQPLAQGAAGGTSSGLETGSTGAQPGQGPSGEAASGADNRVGTRQRQPAPNLDAAQARQVLEALQAAELQYLQQLPHRATRRPDPRKPAW